MSRATPNAAPTASRLVTTPTAAMIGARRATSSSRKPSARTTPMTSGVFALERGLQVVVLGDRAADERGRGKVGAEAVDGGADGPVGRVVGGDDLDHHVAAVPVIAGMTCATPGSALATAATRAASAAGATTCSAPGAPAPKASWTWRVGDARAVAGGHDLDGGHAGLQAQHGDGERDEDDDGERAEGDRAAPQALAPGREARLSGAHRSAPTAARACRPSARAWPARRAAASAWPRG